MGPTLVGLRVAIMITAAFIASFIVKVNSVMVCGGN